MLQPQYQLNFIGQTTKYLYLIEINHIEEDDRMRRPLEYGVSGINEAKVFEQYFNNNNPQDINDLINFINDYESTGPFAKNRELIDRLSIPNIIEVSNNIAKGIDGNLFDLNTINELETCLKKFETLSEQVKLQNVEQSVVKEI